MQENGWLLNQPIFGPQICSIWHFIQLQSTTYMIFVSKMCNNWLEKGIQNNFLCKVSALSAYLDMLSTKLHILIYDFYNIVLIFLAYIQSVIQLLYNNSNQSCPKQMLHFQGVVQNVMSKWCSLLKRFWNFSLILAITVMQPLERTLILIWINARQTIFVRMFNWSNTKNDHSAPPENDWKWFYYGANHVCNPHDFKMCSNVLLLW